MEDKRLKNSISVFLEEAILVKSFPLGKMRISESANSVDQSWAKKNIFIMYLSKKAQQHSCQGYTLPLQSKRRKKQPHSKLYCDVFPTSKKTHAIICPSDINITRLPVLIVFKVKLPHFIVLMHQKIVIGVTRRLNICMFMKKGVMIKIKPPPYWSQGALSD